MKRYNKYEHLNKSVGGKSAFDWKSKIFKKALPPKAFENSLTSKILLGVEKILVLGFETSASIKSYLKF